MFILVEIFLLKKLNKKSVQNTIGFELELNIGATVY